MHLFIAKLLQTKLPNLNASYSLILCFLSFFYSCSTFFKEPGRPPKIDGIPIQDQFRKVYIQNVRNNSYGINIHTKLTQLLKEEVDRRGRFLQTRDRGEAAYKLYSEVVHFQDIGNLLDSANQSVSSELFIVVKIDLIDVTGRKLLLERNEVPIRGYYSNQIGYRETQDMAIERITRNLAIRIVEECENAWYYEMLLLDRLEKEKLPKKEEEIPSITE
jgi:hypothetical protein